MDKAYAIWRAFQDRFLARAAAVLMLGCTLLALLEVVRRYVFGTSYDWQQDAVTGFMLSAVFLYFGISQRHGSHLTVSLLTGTLEAVGPRATRAAEIIKFLATVISFLFLIAVVWWGIPEIEDSLKYGSRTESLAFPVWPFLLTLLVGFGFMVVSLFFQIYHGIQKLRGREVPAEPSAGAALH